MGLIENSRIICAPLMAQSVEQLLSDMHQAEMEGADVAEITVDSITNLNLNLKHLLLNKPISVSLVFRESWNEEEDVLKTLLLAKDLGADYIDLELKIASALEKEDKLGELKSSKIIVSCYLEKFPNLIEQLVDEMQSTGADIIKFVANVSTITQTSNAFSLLMHSQVPTIVYCRGERGLISQLLSFKFGGFWAYGSIQGNTFPGVPSIESLTRAYGVAYIDKRTQVFGLISKPVNHSKGPILHNPTFRHVGYNGVYVPMLVDDLKEFFGFYTSPNFGGFSVGIPYKEAVVNFCDEVHPLAKSIGAANTVIRRLKDGKLVGYNTDCEAAIGAIEDALKGRNDRLESPLSGKQFILAGAGGAGRALAFGAKIRGARVVIFDIDLGRAECLADAVSGEARPFEDLPSFVPEKDAILANATPIGMHPNMDRIPVHQDTLGYYDLVFDAVYTPRKTRLLEEAEAAGAIVVSGVEMFLRQAAAQFSLFTAQKAPEEFMRRIILENF